MGRFGARITRRGGVRAKHACTRSRGKREREGNASRFPCSSHPEGLDDASFRLRPDLFEISSRTLKPLQPFTALEPFSIGLFRETALYVKIKNTRIILRKPYFVRFLYHKFLINRGEST